MRKIVVQIIFLVLCLSSQAQKVFNIRAEQHLQDIVVLYSLEATSSCEVSLFLSQDNGVTWFGPLKNVSGDVGENIGVGENQINWKVLDEREQLVGDKIKFKVLAKVNDEIFLQEMPAYPGGERAFYMFLYNNIEYPEQEKSQNIEGTVFVNFVVEKDGTPTNFIVTRGVEGGKGLDKQALAACMKLGKFNPGKQNGVPQRVFLTIPIKFTLTDGDSEDSNIQETFDCLNVPCDGNSEISRELDGLCNILNQIQKDRKKINTDTILYRDILNYDFEFMKCEYSGDEYENTTLIGNEERTSRVKNSLLKISFLNDEGKKAVDELEYYSSNDEYREEIHQQRVITWRNKKIFHFDSNLGIVVNRSRKMKKLQLELKVTFQKSELKIKVSPSNSDTTLLYCGYKLSNKNIFDHEMVFVEGGSFQMGSDSGQPDESPVHSVTLSSFNIGKQEITQSQWRAVMGSNESVFNVCDQCPVENVSWYDVQEYISKLNSRTGLNYRLPTEAEWEFAAIGGRQSEGFNFSGSNHLGSVAWFTNNSGSKTHFVRNKQANELGISDMSGNVWEWCSDWYGNYNSFIQTNPTGATSGMGRVLRGGSWSSSPISCRPTFRLVGDPRSKGIGGGFRLVLPVVR